MAKDKNGFESIIVESVDEMPKEQDYVDEQGTKFDSDLHRRDKKTKEPIKNKDGSFRKKSVPGSRKSKVGPAPETISSYQSTGKIAAGLTFTLGMAVGGKAFIPSPDEELFISDAYGRYFESMGMEDLPPGWALIAALGMYALPRLQNDEVKERLVTAFNKLTGKGGENAQSGSGTHGNRENTSE